MLKRLYQIVLPNNNSEAKIACCGAKSWTWSDRLWACRAAVHYPAYRKITTDFYSICRQRRHL